MIVIIIIIIIITMKTEATDIKRDYRALISRYSSETVVISRFEFCPFLICQEEVRLFLFNFAKRVKLSVIFNSATKTVELTQPRPIRLSVTLPFFPPVDCVTDVILL